MLQIVLFLLKFIAVLLLVLVGFVVTVLLIVLLVPVRYRVRVEHEDVVQAEGRISWLLHIIHGGVSVQGGKHRIWLRIFGFIFYDSSRPKRVKKREKAKGLNRKEKPVNKVKSKYADNTGEPENEDRQKEPEDIRESSEIEEEDIKEPDHIEEPGDIEPPESIEQSEDIRSRQSVFKRMVQKLKNLFANIKKVIQTIKNVLHNLRERIRGLWNKVSVIVHKAGMVKNFIDQEDNRQGFAAVFQRLKDILRHLKPTKFKSELIIGMEDPYSTGRVITILSMFYGIYGEHVSIIPDFENKVLKGRHFIKGRIRLGTLLIIVIKLLLDKRIKPLKQNLRLLKEAL